MAKLIDIVDESRKERRVLTVDLSATQKELIKNYEQLIEIQRNLIAVQDKIIEKLEGENFGLQDQLDYIRDVH